MQGKIFLWFRLTLCGVALAACTTQTPYSPVEEGRYGFTEQKIESNRFRVTFKGNSLTQRDTVENYLLYRAAELTLEHGYDYFVVVDEETEKKSMYESVGLYRPFPYYSHYVRRPPHTPHENVTLRERSKYTAWAYIRLFKGKKPAAANAFGAHEVRKNLEPNIQRTQ